MENSVKLTEEQKRFEKEVEEQNYLLKKLSNIKEFQTWRDIHIKPVLEECKIARENCLKLDETTLKAILLYENKINNLFIDIFKNL